MENNKWIHHIKIGDYVEALIHIITLGYGARLSEWIAVDILGYDSCGCCERKEWLNRLTNPHYDGECNQIKLF
jgi:hypothetical protein